jgi:hypothetical protein
MRKILLLFVLFACSSKEKIEPPPSPTVVEDKSQWTPYEGTIKTELGEWPIELYLDESQPGLTSSFEIRGNSFANIGLNMFGGKYTTLPGATGNEVIFQLHGNIMIFPRTKPDPKKGVTSFKPEVQEIDLFFITEGGNKLILVDEDFDRVSEDNRYTLFKRSRLFTVEGYVTIEDTHTEFFEKNTHENWLVAPIGVYNEVQNIYDSLVTGKSEGMNLKAVAYFIESDSLFNEPRKNNIWHHKGVGSELLVIKRILQMKKSEAYTDSAKAAGLGY